jgi:hypothetical protein
MKIADVPNAAFTAPATEIPMKQVFDWDALFKIMQDKGFVIIETDLVRVTAAGTEEAVLVKAFNSHVCLTQKQKLRTKRISATRWFCCL